MKFSPQNKWIVIDPIEDAGKAGVLYIPGSINGQYKLARLVSSSDEMEWNVKPGSLIIYDSLGTVSIRIDDKMNHFVKAVNVISIVEE